jgi:hypothetical protein
MQIRTLEAGRGRSGTKRTRDVCSWAKADIASAAVDVRSLGVKQTQSGRRPMLPFDINCPLDQFLRNSRGIKIQGGKLRNA